MNTNINNVLDIDMSKMEFHLSDQLPFDEEGNVLINLGQGILNNSYNEEQAILKVQTQFVLIFTNEQIEVDPNINSIDDSFQGHDDYLVIRYNLYVELNDDSKDVGELISEISFTKEIYAILEPYIRQSISYVFNQSNLPDPVLPYRYWEKFYDET